MNKLTKLFLILAFLTMVCMGMRELNLFIFFCSLADIVGIWAIVKSFKTGEI
jgi:hypothetical protein